MKVASFFLGLLQSSLTIEFSSLFSRLPLFSPSSLPYTLPLPYPTVFDSYILTLPFLHCLCCFRSPVSSLVFLSSTTPFLPHFTVHAVTTLCFLVVNSCFLQYMSPVATSYLFVSVLRASKFDRSKKVNFFVFATR